MVEDVPWDPHVILTTTTSSSHQHHQQEDVVEEEDEEDKRAVVSLQQVEILAPGEPVRLLRPGAAGQGHGDLQVDEKTRTSKATTGNEVDARGAHRGFTPYPPQIKARP